MRVCIIFASPARVFVVVVANHHRRLSIEYDERFVCVCIQTTKRESNIIKPHAIRIPFIIILQTFPSVELSTTETGIVQFNHVLVVFNVVVSVMRIYVWKVHRFNPKKTQLDFSSELGFIFVLIKKTVSFSKNHK